MTRADAIRGHLLEAGKKGLTFNSLFNRLNQDHWMIGKVRTSEVQLENALAYLRGLGQIRRRDDGWWERS